MNVIKTQTKLVSETGRALSTATVGIDTGQIAIDGKIIYRKVIQTGALPNATTKNVAHGLTTPKLLRMWGAARTVAGVNIPLPYSHHTDTNGVTVSIDGTNVILISGVDMSSYTTGEVVLEYTL